MRLTRTAQTLAVAALAAAVLTGCAEDDADDDKGSPDASGATSQSATESPTPSETPQPEPVDAGDVEAFCAAYEVLSEIDPAAKDPAELKVNVTAFAAAAVDAAEAAPPEIQEPAHYLADRLPEYVAMVEAADYRPTKQQVLDFFGDPQVAGAGKKLDAFAERNCDS